MEVQIVNPGSCHAMKRKNGHLSSSWLSILKVSKLKCRYGPFWPIFSMYKSKTENRKPRTRQGTILSLIKRSTKTSYRGSRPIRCEMTGGVKSTGSFTRLDGWLGVHRRDTVAFLGLLVSHDHLYQLTNKQRDANLTKSSKLISLSGTR